MEHIVRSIQNLEAVINEGLRVALLEETPDQSLEVLLEYQPIPIMAFLNSLV